LYGRTGGRNPLIDFDLIWYAHLSHWYINCNCCTAKSTLFNEAAGFSLVDGFHAITPEPLV
jgi:hypothetical protein